MVDETDGIEEALDGQMRLVVMAAGQAGERLARAREDQLRHAQAASEREARELASRLAAEQRAARAELASVHRSDWWDRASAAHIARTYQVARAWGKEDPEAVRAGERIRDELRTRFGVDVGEDSDPALMRTAVEHADPSRATRAAAPQQAPAREVREIDQARAWFAQHDPDRLAKWQREYQYADSAHARGGDEARLVRAWKAELERAEQARAQAESERQREAVEVAEAHQLMGLADQENRRPDEHRADERDGDPSARVLTAEQHRTRAAAVGQDAHAMYDSAQRRADTASELEAKGIDGEVVAARMHADVSQGRPATEAVKGAGVRKAPRARRPRGRSVQAQRTGLSR